MANRSDVSRQDRARKRESWTVRKFALGEEPGDDLSDTTTPSERLAMMWSLAVEAWTLSGRAIPDYDRSNLPARMYRPGEVPPD